MAKKKKFRMIDAILTVICVVFVAEAAAPAAAIGNSQFSWWIFLIIAFLMPYGLIVCELGTTYADDEGGIADWVRRAFGDKWGSRVSWYYWINFPLWMASLAFLFPETIALMTGFELDLIPTLAIELAFVWIVVFMSFSKVSDSGWILNLSAVLKVLIAVSVGGLGIYYAVTNGFASDMSPATFLPSMDASSLTYLSIILFNFMGFEVICTFAGAMKNPSKDIPKAIVLGGLAIGAIYLFCSFGIGAAIPADQIDPDFGMIYAVMTMVGEASPIFMLICIIFLVTLFANMASWSFGVNFVADYAAKHGNMPKVFSHENAKTEMPTGAAIVNGVVASLALMLQLIPIPAISEGIFWMLFSMNVVFLLISYIPMFPAFLKMRKVDPNRKRVFTFPFKGKLMYVMLAIPAIELVLAIIATIVPLNGSEEELSKIPMLIGVIVFVVLGEVVRIWSKRGRTAEYKGLTPALAAERLAEEAAEEAADEAEAPEAKGDAEAEPVPVA